MILYKFLDAGRRAPITGFIWPQSGWVEASGSLSPCRNGVHACRIAHLPHWVGPELWAIDLDGEMIEGPDSVVARRGRLVRLVEDWSNGAALEFAEDCARRATTLAGDTGAVAGRASDARADAAEGWVSAAAYIAAAVAGEVNSGSPRGSLYEQHFVAERARQAAWMKKRLNLVEG